MTLISIILLLLVYCTYLVFFTLLIVNMYISNAGPHQPMAASFFNLQDQIKYVCMYVCMYHIRILSIGLELACNGG